MSISPIVGLPKVLNYNEVAPTLPPDSQSYNTSVVPSNGSIFNTPTQIFFDLPRADFLVPDSVFLKGNISITATAASGLVGLPATSMFQRLETQIGGTTFESISNFNQVNTLISNITLNSSQKQGVQSSYGYTDTSVENLNGRVLAIGVNTFSFAIPLLSMITQCKKYLPLFAMPTVRFVLYIDQPTAWQSYIAAGAANITAYSLYNLEMCYESYNPGVAFKNEILAMPSISLKTIMLDFASQTMPTGSAGSQSLNYNLRHSSIKSAFLTPSPSVATAVYLNGPCGDFTEITNNTGSYQLHIGNQYFPQKAISMLQARAGQLLELKKASTSLGVEYETIYDKANNFAIDAEEWAYLPAAGNTTLIKPSKAGIIGIHTEKLHNNRLFFSGVSSQDTAIVANINMGTYTTVSSFNVGLLLVVDAVIVIDVANQQVMVRH